MSERLSTALVTTATPERYAKQLASHLGRRSQIIDEPDGLRIVLETGDCLLQTRAGVLVMKARADSEPNLETVKRVIAVHLERFGQRNELRVEWDAS
ncbi:DUF2218 domain-containing protein [Arthrobacter sp. NPDC057009]|uniref:DUF2218 domain-containing protein n=1 Tax=Arthrobacter sp. NPDC057009 TaxID=3345996 RepID=UPI0036254FD6